MGLVILALDFSDDSRLANTTGSIPFVFQEDMGELHLTVLASMLCLPVALLVWSVIWFTIALSVFSFLSLSTPSSFDPSAETIFIVMFAAVTIMVPATLFFLWHVWRGPRRVEVSDEDALDIVNRGWKASFVRFWLEMKERAGKEQRKSDSDRA